LEASTTNGLLDVLRILSNFRRSVKDLLPDHTGMTDFMRLHFGLWDGNTALIESCACNSPDSAAMLLIELTCLERNALAR
jgi:hypothetical protein